MLYTKLHLFIVIEKFINHLVNIKLDEMTDRHNREYDLQIT